jgi:hypothetical protein
MPARVGEIYRDSAFYLDQNSGELKPKFLLVLAVPRNGDLVARLLTSRYAGLRPQNPACFHGDPYPGFFLGILGGQLTRMTWLDLRGLSDLDPWDFAQRQERALLCKIGELPAEQLRPALECAARADDTTRAQERAIRDALADIAA